MSASKLYYYAVLLILLIPLMDIQPQVQNLIITDTTITTTAIFTGRNSITAGPNFTVSNTGNATFITGGQIYLRSGVSVVSGGIFKTALDTTLVGVEDENVNTIPENFRLDQNYPNPFNPATAIRYSVPSSEFITLKVYDILGKEVAILVNEEKASGSYEIMFDAANIPSGIYFYQLKAGSFIKTKKMILMK